MKVHLLCFLIAALSLANIYCSSTKHEAQKNDGAPREAQIIGTLYAAGNEPFVKLRLAADNGENFLIETDSLVLKQLWQLQGRRIHISGTEHQARLGKILYVKDYKILQ